MTARALPPHPNLGQLKRQAKELLERWKSDSPAPAGSRQPRLRDAQRAIATEHGFSSWDALRAHVERPAGQASDATAATPRRGLDYGDPIRDAILVRGPLTREAVQRLTEQGVSSIRLDESVTPETLRHLAHLTALRRIDFSDRHDLLDEHVSFLEALPTLTTVSFNGCHQITDAAIAHLRNHHQLERINLDWTRAGDGALESLADKPALSRVLIGGRTTDKGVATLRNFPALAAASGADTFLSISSARELTDVALAEIGKLNGVVALDVHTSAFGSPHYTARGVAHLKEMASLEELNFHGHLATDAVLAEVAGIRRLRHLHCQDAISGDEGFVALGQCLTLDHLNARVCPRVGNRGFAAIAGLPRLSQLGLGGPRITDEAMAFLADSSTIEDLGPVMFGDAAFEHIARIPRLQRLTNMYNRATTDSATRFLREHRTLTHYSAFGTQITDESLRVLATIPQLERLDFENCAGITDAGLRELARLPRLRHVSVWSCVNVNGTWTEAAASTVEATSEAAPRLLAARYRAETLLDHPDMAVPENIADLMGIPLEVRDINGIAVLGLSPAFAEDGIRLTPETAPTRRNIGVLTRDAFDVPIRIQLAVRPIAELRLIFGAHNRVLAFDEYGNVQDPEPWFMRSPAIQGRPHHAEDAAAIASDQWTRAVLEIDRHEKRLLVNGSLRHTWNDDFTGIRSRIAVGMRKSGLSVRELKIERL